MREDNKVFIWCEAETNKRNAYGEFKREFDLKDVPKDAKICVFGDTVYQMKINGKIVGFGPVRFDPRFPQYDEYEISEYLQAGKNEILVVVNYFGMKTYKSIPCQAGFVAWGNAGDVDLSTGKNLWKARISGSRQAYMSKQSFALNPMEFYDQTQADAFDWGDEVIVADQNKWGTLSARYIPFMSLKPLSVNANASLYPIIENEDIYGFQTELPAFYDDNSSDFSSFIAFATWIYSPKKQQVVAGTFWGETWMNGEEIKAGTFDPSKNMRINQIWDLNEGWNFFFGKVGGYSDYLYQMYSVPKTAGLVFAADKKMDSKYSFKFTKVLPIDEFKQHLESKPLPYAADDELSEIGGWNFFEKDTMITSPCRFNSWADYGPVIENVSLSELKGKTISKELYPNGINILFDLGATTLVFPSIKVKNAKGSIIDICHSESMLDDNIHPHYEFNYLPGDRAIVGEDLIHFTPIQPRGMRYVSISITNIENDVVIEDIAFMSASYPVEHKGSFKCNDELLNNIWKMCELTQETNMEDAYVDCTGRERGMYFRDTIIQYYNNLSSFGDHKLMRRCLELYGQSPAADGKFRAVYPNTGSYTIADFSLDALDGYCEYYENTGDIELIRTYWDAILNNMKWFDDLSDENEYKLLDSEWHIHRGLAAMYGGFHGDLGIHPDLIDNTGIHCTFSCTYLYAINCTIKLAKALGDTEAQKKYEERAAILKKNINSLLFDEKVGAYKDSLTSDVHSTHANIYAILSGAASEDQLPRIQAYIRKTVPGEFINGYGPEAGVRFSPSYAFYILKGLFIGGMADVAMKIIRTGWGWFLYKGLVQCPEYFRLGGSESWCHAWSACPMYYLSFVGAGVTFPNPENRKEIKLVESPLDLEWAEISIPYEKGNLYVKWHRENGKIVYDKIEAPSDVKLI